MSKYKEMSCAVKLLYLGPSHRPGDRIMHCYVLNEEEAKPFIPDRAQGRHGLGIWSPRNMKMFEKKLGGNASAEGHWVICEGGAGDGVYSGPFIPGGRSDLDDHEIEFLVNRRWATNEQFRMWKNAEKASRLPLRSLAAIEELTATYQALPSGGAKARWLNEVNRLIITGNKAYLKDRYDH
tara:strand:- start:403 stop:945 length:543 start_codon:yes stop_codon:yes gene_type:complete